MLLFKGWARRIGIRLLLVSLIAGLIAGSISAFRGGGKDAAHMASYATGVAWNHAFTTRDAQLGAMFEQEMATHTVGSFQTAIAETNKMYMAASPVPTMMIELWGAYKVVIDFAKKRFESVLTGTPGVEVNVEPILALQDEPLARFNASCGYAVKKSTSISITPTPTS